MEPHQVIFNTIDRIKRPSRIDAVKKNNVIILKPQPYKPLSFKEIDAINKAIWQIAETIPK